MRTSKIHKMTRMGRPARRGAIVLALAGVVVAVGAGSGIADNDAGNGRDPNAVPGAVSDVPSPAAVTDGRGAGAAPSGQARATAAPAAAVLDTGRGGVDPASGPNPVVADAARSTAVAESGIDTDSGVVQAPAAGAAATAPEAPVDEDVPGAAASRPTVAADTAARSATEAPVDLDQP